MRKQLSLLYVHAPPTSSGAVSGGEYSPKQNYFQQDPSLSVSHSLSNSPQCLPVRLHVYEQALVKRTAVERFTLVASSDCYTDCTDTASPSIDAILVYGRRDAPIESYAVHETKSPNQLLPVVLYCPPNAGFYECIGMAPVESNWVGVYSQLVGLDVCVFNYRCILLCLGQLALDIGIVFSLTFSLIMPLYLCVPMSCLYVSSSRPL